MKLLRSVFAGIKSLGAAVLTAAACFIPAWSAHLAITYGIVPQWVYGPIAVLVLVGSSIVLAFLAKAYQGLSPLKD